VIAGSALPFEPTANDYLEIPASSVRGSGAYKTLRILEVDFMRVGGAVFQSTLTVSE